MSDARYSSHSFMEIMIYTFAYKLKFYESCAYPTPLASLIDDVHQGVSPFERFEMFHIMVRSQTGKSDSLCGSIDRIVRQGATKQAIFCITP